MTCVILQPINLGDNSLTASPSHSRPAPSAAAGAALLILVIVLLTPCVGLAGSVGYLSLRTSGALSRWRSLGTPPEAAAEIAAGDTERLYVRTDSGSLYRCENFSWQRSGACWVPSQAPFDLDPNADFAKGLFGGQVPPPPGEVRDELKVMAWFAEDAFETRYAVLADGSVWVWQYDVGSYRNLAVLAVGPLAGFGLGLVVAALLAVRSARWGQRSAPGQPAG